MFIPISAGGKISNLDIAKKYIQSGADKLVINSNLFNKNLLKKIANTFWRTMYCRIFGLYKCKW